MGTIELFDFIFENNIDLNLKGNLELIDDEIKWSYDGLADTYEYMQDHLLSIYEEDYEILNDFLLENKLIDYFILLTPDFDDSIVSFIIVES